MIPVHCIVKHNVDAGTFGDCVRACIASLLELPAEDVPHFYHDDCDGETGNARISEWLAGRGLVPFWSAFPGSDPLDAVLQHMNAINPNVHYMLYGNTGFGDHVVVCQGGKIVHDPAWVPDGLAAPNSSGLWVILVLAHK
jgi:hypothetical protein